MAALEQQRQDGAGGGVAGLQGLVGIGVAGEIDGTAPVAGPAQFVPQAFRQSGAGDQPGLEVQSRGEVPVGVAGPGIAVDAAMLAATIGIDRTVEGQVGGSVPGQGAA